MQLSIVFSYFSQIEIPFIFHYCSHETGPDVALFRSLRSFYDLVVGLYDYRSFGKTYRSHLQGCLETSVPNHHSKLRNIT